MKKFSFHNHTTYSDGNNTMQEMFERAYESGFDIFAMTDHIHSDRTPQWTLTYDKYDEYLSELDKYKKLYEGKMTILSGIEADWYNGEGTYYGRFDMLRGRLDFVVGSVHNLLANGGDFIIDGSTEEFKECLNDGFCGNIKDMVACYYESYGEMVENFEEVNLFAHIDLIQKNNVENLFFDETEKWVRDLQKDLAKKMGKRNAVTEVNGGGAYRRGNNIYYPSKQFIHYLDENNVRFTVGLDSHSVDMVDKYYDVSVKYLKDAGIEKLWYFDAGQWV